MAHDTGIQRIELPSIDLNQPANVLWFAVPPLADAENFGGHMRQFESVTAAIRFVMEELPFYGQSTAWIATDTGRVELIEIKLLYAQMK